MLQSLRAFQLQRCHAKEAIQKLSYSPNLLGRNLRRGATKSILVLLNTISNPFYSRVVKGIEERAAQDGYSVMLYMTHGDMELERRAVTLLQTKLIDGAIFLSTEQPGEKLTELCRGIPPLSQLIIKKRHLMPSAILLHAGTVRLLFLVQGDPFPPLFAGRRVITRHCGMQAYR